MEFADAKGYTIVDVFTDDGISGYIDDTNRPGFNALAARIAAGAYDIVIATNQKRLGRNVAEWEPAIKLLRSAKVPFEPHYGGGPWNMTLAKHREYARTQVVKGSAEVEVRMELQHARNQDELRAGLPLWGPRFFGFTIGTTVGTPEKGRVTGLHDLEAEAIRKAAADLLNGATLYSIAKAWNESGLKTPRGHEWAPAAVRNVLLRPRNAGWLAGAQG
ncbi:MAG: recombinase [Rhodoglobus sp.]|nr:recombinase [Rhodoglobus sp.]